MVIVQATDAAGNMSSQTVTITVKRRNIPIITSSENGINIDENSEADAFVYQITASGSDTFTYAIGGDDAAALTVDNTSGIVRLKTSPDYETKNSYTFTVTATAEGVTSAPKTVTFSIINVVEPIEIIGIDVDEFGDSIVKIPEDETIVGTFKVKYVDGREIDNSDVVWSKSDSPEDRYLYEINEKGVLSFVTAPSQLSTTIKARLRTTGSVMGIVASVKDGDGVLEAMHTIRIQTTAV